MLVNCSTFTTGGNNKKRRKSKVDFKLRYKKTFATLLEEEVFYNYCLLMLFIYILLLYAATYTLLHDLELLLG